jgi:ATP-dependent Clp protease ATP-binding subunit ClpA
VRELSGEDTLDILRARKERLERHHNVVISEGALHASIQLTDLHQKDRMRPDRAIDALDEACAHTHAVAEYSSRAEDLIRKRRLATRARATEPRQRPRVVTDDIGMEEEDPLGSMARDGFAALERFGAEIEAMFGPGAPAPVGDGQPAPSASRTPVVPAREEESPGLAELDAQLAIVLAEEGIVVRGHDVARVVALGAGVTVTWAE